MADNGRGIHAGVGLVLRLPHLAALLISTSRRLIARLRSRYKADRSCLADRVGIDGQFADLPVRAYGNDPAVIGTAGPFDLFYTVIDGSRNRDAVIVRVFVVVCIRTG